METKSDLGISLILLSLGIILSLSLVKLFGFELGVYH